MQLFSADATIFSKKFEFIFAPENIKKRTSKVAHNQPQTFFSQYWPGCPNQPRIDFSYYKYVPRLICLIICVVNSLGSFFLAFLLAYSLINTILHSCIVAHIASEIAFLSEINDAIRFFETQKLCNNGVGHRVWIYIYFTGNLVLQFESEPFICICCIKIPTCISFSSSNTQFYESRISISPI